MASASSPEASGSKRNLSGNIDALIDEPRLGRLQVQLFAICAFVLFCEGYDLQALALAVPDIALEFRIALDDFSMALSASLFGMAIGGAAFAPLGDRIGRKPMLVFAMLITGASTLAALIEPTTLWIAFCRLLTGIGLGITAVNAAAITSEYAPAKWRFLIMTLLTCCVPLGAFTAAMIAPMLIELWGWQGIFWIGGIAPLVAAALVLLGAVESIKWLLMKKPGDPRIVIIARQLAPGIDTSSLHLAQQPTDARQSVVGLLSPSHRVRTLVVWLSAASGAFCLYLMVSWLPTVLREAQWSTQDALRGTAAVQLGGIVGSLLMAWAIDRRKLLAALLVGYGSAALALLAIGLLPGSIVMWQLLLLLVGAGTSGMQAVWMAIAVVLYPLELRATSAGWVAAVSRLGAVSAPLVGGAAVAMHMEARHILLALVIPIGASTIAILLARKYFVPPPPATKTASQIQGDT